MIRQNKYIWHIVCAVLAALTFHSTSIAGWKESPEIGQIFKSAEVHGTFVLYDVTANAYIGHDKARAEKRFIPASTFKIPNTLIGLSVGAVQNVDEVLPYKGDPHPFIEAWVKDMGLREAIALSNAAIYQELARRIGLERMRDNVSRLGYGNKEIGAAVDIFWLNGPLKISAVEQTQFLARLAQNALPFPQVYQKSVCEIVLLDRSEDRKLFGKTGWQNAPDPGVGWWVGWVEKNSRFYAFALNMDIQKASDASKRVETGKACLNALGIL